MAEYAVRFRHDSLAFSACHFLAFENDTADSPPIAEPLHGHNFRVSVEIAGPLDYNGCVVDFVAAFRILRELVDSFHHKTLLPARSVYLTAVTRGPMLHVFFPDTNTERFALPERDALFLDVDNASTERIAFVLLDRFRSELFGTLLDRNRETLYSFELELEESAGCSAVVRAGRNASEI